MVRYPGARGGIGIARRVEIIEEARVDGAD